MNALVKKEVRLLQPVWLAVLALEVVLPWICADAEVLFGLTPVAFFFGMILLAVEPFGREISLGTFSSFLAQPLQRRAVWNTKMRVLFLGAALIFTAYFASCELRLYYLWLEDRLSIGHGLALRTFQVMLASGAGAFLALAGGLWTVLLLRQVAAAFWITFLAPTSLLVIFALSLPVKYADNNEVLIPLLYGLGAVYIAAGFWLAHRLFHRAQDAAWTGGVISLSRWRYFESRAVRTVSRRRHQPFLALLKKELQLQSITVFCAGTLLVLHLVVFLLRACYVPFHHNSVAEVISDVFWTLWLVLPLLIGGAAVAEDRKLGVAESQFCLPVSRRKQFALKFSLVLLLGTLLGGVLPMGLESLAAWLHIPSDTVFRNFRAGQFGGREVVEFELWMVALAALLSWVSFFASTLTRHFLQALSVTVVTLVAGSLLVGWLVNTEAEHPHFSMLGIGPWPCLPLVLIGAPTLLCMMVWLVYGNYNWSHEGWRLWRRNTLGFLKATLFVLGSSALVYHRAWEIFEPAEPPHGPAHLSMAAPPTLRNNAFNGMLVRLPDGRVWYDNLNYSFLTAPDNSHWRQFWRMLADPRPASAGPRQFLAGSNWVSVSAVQVGPSLGPRFLYGSGRDFGYLDTVGIKADGTLWISRASAPHEWTGRELTQVGDETNWQQVVRQGARSFLLLKRDGTLWRWGRWGTQQSDRRYEESTWPTVRNQPLRQIGTDSDWTRIMEPWGYVARKADGSSWSVLWDNRSETDKVQRMARIFDDLPWSEELVQGMNGAAAYVSANGALWLTKLQLRSNENGSLWEGRKFEQVGPDTNWVAAAIAWPTLVALKKDGTLWRWPAVQTSTAELFRTPPARLGIHEDWLALAPAVGGLVSLAADGSLWLWSLGDQEPGIPLLLQLPKQPKRLGNVLSESPSRGVAEL